MLFLKPDSDKAVENVKWPYLMGVLLFFLVVLALESPSRDKLFWIGVFSESLAIKGKQNLSVQIVNHICVGIVKTAIKNHTKHKQQIASLSLANPPQPSIDTYELTMYQSVLPCPTYPHNGEWNSLWTPQETKIYYLSLGFIVAVEISWVSVSEVGTVPILFLGVETRAPVAVTSGKFTIPLKGKKKITI